MKKKFSSQSMICPLHTLWTLKSWMSCMYFSASVNVYVWYSLWTANVEESKYGIFFLNIYVITNRWSLTKRLIKSTAFSWLWIKLRLVCWTFIARCAEKRCLFSGHLMASLLFMSLLGGYHGKTLCKSRGSSWLSSVLSLRSLINM